MNDYNDKLLARWTKYRKICLMTMFVGLLTNASFVVMDYFWWKGMCLQMPTSNIVFRVFIALIAIFLFLLSFKKFDGKNLKQAKIEIILVVAMFTLGTIAIAYCTYIRNGISTTIRISNLTPMCIIGVVVIMCLPSRYSYVMLALFSSVSAIALKVIDYSCISEDIMAQALFIAALLIINEVFKKQFDIEYEMEKKIEKMALFDQLTGLYNRNYITEKLLNKDDSVPMAAAVIMLDIDFFKRFNDKYGHKMGDIVLKAVAESLLGTIRKDDIAIRWGGEEILVLFRNMPRNGIALNMDKICERIRKAIEDQYLPVDDKVTVSIGATMRRPKDDFNSLVNRADDALYSAKENGRNRYFIE